jgi:hypothetical protein
VETGDDDIVKIGQSQALVDFFMPNSVFGLGAPGIGFLAVSMTEPRVDPKSYARAGTNATELLDHIWGTAIHVQSKFIDQIQGFSIKNVVRVNDTLWIAVRIKSGG